MGPDRPRQKEVKPHAEDRSVEARIEIEPWSFELHFAGIEQISQTVLDAFARRLDSVITPRIEEPEKAIRHAATSAPNLDALGLGIHPFVEQADELLAPRLLKRLQRHSQESVPRYHF